MFYLLPFIADLIVAMMLFVAPVWAATSGASVRFTCAIGVTASACYLLTNLLLSKFANPRVAPRLLVAALLTSVVASVAGVFAPNYYWMLPFAAGIGVGAGFFFAPFQMVMSEDGDCRPLGTSVILYNLSWSMGYMLGPFLAGALLARSRASVHAIAAALGIVALFPLLRVLAARRAKAAGGEEGEQHADPLVRREGRQFYIWVGWGSVLLQGYVTSTIGYVFPKLGLSRGFSEFQLGLIGSTHVLMQMILMVILWRLRSWLYRPWATLMAAGLGTAGFLLLATTATMLANVCGVMLIGSAGGINFYSAVYYANAHDDRSKAVGVQEAMVGLGMLLGPGIGALLTGRQEVSLMPYWWCAVFFALLGLGTAVLHWSRIRASNPR